MILKEQICNVQPAVSDGFYIYIYRYFKEKKESQLPLPVALTSPGVRWRHETETTEFG